MRFLCERKRLLAACAAARALVVIAVAILEFTAPSIGQATKQGHATAAATTAAEQAQAKLISGVYSGLRIQAIFFYQLRDTAVYNSAGQIVKLVYWGLVTRDLAREKPGFQAYADVPQGALPPLQ
jgi:hypothetical protein